jgi:ribosomal protein L14E/L6E/L27E
MPLIEAGRVCVKKFGRDAGAKAVVTSVLDANTVMIMTAERPKERKCNIKHLEFLNEKIDANDKSMVEKTLEIEPQQPKSKKA